jgi:hypothetical protein
MLLASTRNRVCKKHKERQIIVVSSFKAISKLSFRSQLGLAENDFVFAGDRCSGERREQNIISPSTHLARHKAMCFTSSRIQTGRVKHNTHYTLCMCFVRVYKGAMHITLHNIG